MRTNVEHQQLHDAEERRIQLEAQALRAAHLQEQESSAYSSGISANGPRHYGRVQMSSRIRRRFYGKGI